MATKKSRGTPVVIVESPAKARTIGKYLGSNYRIEASIGHIRDLPSDASEVPQSLKKEKWAKLGIDVARDFKALYVVPADKRDHLKKLKSLVADARLAEVDARIQAVLGKTMEPWMRLVKSS